MARKAIPDLTLHSARQSATRLYELIAIMLGNSAIEMSTLE